MALVASSVGVDGPDEALLRPTSMVAEPGRITLVEAQVGPAATTYALALAGRVKLTCGTATWGYDYRPHLRRRAVALVDLPGVTEPDGGLPVRAVIRQELALAKAPSSRRHVAAFLADHGAADLASVRWESAPPGRRTAWLAELAARHPDVRALVLTHPDRHGGHLEDWMRPLEALLRDDLVIVVLCTASTKRLLGRSETYAIGVAS